MYTPQDNVNEPLYVVTVIFNPVRFKSRWKLYRDFALRVRQAGAILITVEAAMGERTHALEDNAIADNDSAIATIGEPRSHGPAPLGAGAGMPSSRIKQEYLKLRVMHQQEIWLKENLANIAAQHLPEDAKYIAFVDADTAFNRPDWVSETLHALQHYHVIQMFSSVTELSPQYTPHAIHHGFAYSYSIHGDVKAETFEGYYGGGRRGHITSRWHPGYAWAWRREALDAVGGLVDWAILGAADRHMAFALVGHGDGSMHRDVHPKYREKLKHWERRAVEHIKYNIGFIDGNLTHFWHGRKANRQYANRWKILVKHRFNPDTDLKRDWRGIIRLTDTKPQLRDDIRRYFRARHEDSIDMPGDDDRILGPAPSGGLR